LGGQKGICVPGGMMKIFEKIKKKTNRKEKKEERMNGRDEEKKCLVPANKTRGNVISTFPS
jgi:hypothetical protein